jgi:outer membrane biosynthesis protein TonB
MRASRTTVTAALALLILAPLPVATAISAAATTAPRTLDLDDVGDTVGGAVDSTTGTVGEVTDPVEDIVEPQPEPEAPVVVPDPVAPAPAVPTPPKPAPAPAPVPKPSTEKPSIGTTPRSGFPAKPESKSDAGTGTGAQSDAGGSSGNGDGSSGSESAGGTSTNANEVTPSDTTQGAKFASAGPRTSSFLYEGAAPLLPVANAGDPNIRSLLIAGGQRSQGISPVADDTPGSIAGLLLLGTLASLMMYGSAAYLKFGRRRPAAAGKHKG